ncbi:hypothetical protein FQR65_LT18401 [Abscondita terminalis]|nr:hypothetical protein FQR65_LT18401 [Abscondita terminalis]
MGTHEQSIRLIQLYSSYKMLWDPKDPKYLNKTQREDSWKQIAAEMQCPVGELKKKMESLLGSYRREKSREKKSRITGSGADEVYISKWFGYPYFDFMKNKNEPGDTQDTIPIEITQQFSQSSDTVAYAENASTSHSLSESNLEPPQASQEQHTEETSTNVPTQEPARKKRRNISKTQTQPQLDSADIMLAEALDCLKKSSNDINDPYLSFGRHIANEMRKYDPHTLACVKNAINNIIFEADLGKYRQQQYFTHQYNQSLTSSSSSHIMSPSPAVTPSPNDNFDFEAQDITSL